MHVFLGTVAKDWQTVANVRYDQGVYDRGQEIVGDAVTHVGQ